MDNGISGLIPFIKSLTCPILAANLNLTKVPELRAETNLLNSIIFDINGTKIGVIGYLTPETKTTGKKNDIEYIEEVTAIKEEITKLKNKGVNILIALGHSGYFKDLQIAKEVKDIDLVIGGHSHSFLWNGTEPDTEKAQGPYPTMVKQDSGKIVPTVQAYANTKYLGKLVLTFNSNGDLLHVDGKPILLDNSVPQDPQILEIVKDYSNKVQQFTEVTVGATAVNLDGQSCRLRECNMGNLIADAAIKKYATKYQIHSLFDAPVAVVNGGNIRISIGNMNLPANITRGELIQVLPFQENLVKISLNGSIIKQMFEQSASQYKPVIGNGGFLQVSGMKVVYDFQQPPGERVEKVYIRCGECTESGYSVLNITKMYEILVTHFLAIGGDCYPMLAELPSTPLDFGLLESTVDYLAHFSPVSPRIEGRINIKNYEKLTA